LDSGRLRNAELPGNGVALVARYAILIPKNALTDFAGLRKHASELAQKHYSIFWWAPQNTEIAFCFEKHGTAICFKIHCINNGTPNRSEWPKSELPEQL
jgi:uncharacterized protein CbrC (UPF0167 family)